MKKKQHVPLAQETRPPFSLLSFFAVSTQLILLVLLTLFNYYIYNTPKISTGNSAARVLLAVGQPFHIGRPYTDLFEYVPPGLLIALTTWIDAFGISMYSFRALHALLVFTSGLLLILILRKVLRFWPAEVAVFFPLLITVFSRAIQTDIFSIESFGTTFALAGLTALLYITHPVTKLALGSGLLFAASQIKETFLLCGLALLYPYIDVLRKRPLLESIKIFLASLYGPLAVVALLVSYVVFHDAVGGYIYVLQRKLELVQKYTISGAIENLEVVINFYAVNYLARIKILTELTIISIGLTLLLGMWNYSKTKKLFVLKKGVMYSSVTTLLFCFGIFGGFMIYGQISHGMRMLSIGIALYILIGMLIAYPLRALTELIPQRFLRGIVQIISAVIIAYLLLPNYLVLRDYQYNVAPQVSYDYFVENKIISKVSPEECILHLYGWEVPQTYIYTKRRPCTKFFLANLVVGRPARIKEYQDEVVSNPASAIIFNTAGTDLNLPAFDQTVINFPQILKHCYTRDPEVVQYMDYFFAPVDLYFKNEDLDQEEMRKCYQDYGFGKEETK